MDGVVSGWWYVWHNTWVTFYVPVGGGHAILFLVPATLMYLFFPAVLAGFSIQLAKFEEGPRHLFPTVHSATLLHHIHGGCLVGGWRGWRLVVRKVHYMGEFFRSCGMWSCILFFCAYSILLYVFLGCAGGF